MGRYIYIIFHSPSCSKKKIAPEVVEQRRRYIEQPTEVLRIGRGVF